LPGIRTIGQPEIKLELFSSRSDVTLHHLIGMRAALISSSLAGKSVRRKLQRLA